MNIFQFLRIVGLRWQIIGVTLAASILAGIAVVQLVPRQYEATSRVLLELIRPDPVTGEVIGSAFARAYTSTQIELIKDHRVAGRAVDKLGWQGSAQLAAGYQRSGSEQPFRRWLANQIIDGTNARLIQGSNILEIVYTGQSPDQAAAVVNALREAYEEQAVQFKRQGAGKNARWFKGQTDSLRVQLAAAEKRKADFEKANDIILQDDQTDTDSARLAALASTSPMPAMVSAAPPVQIAGPGPAQMQLAQLDAAIASAARTLGANHPDYIGLRAQRDATAAAAAQERSVAAANARAASVGPASGGPSAGALFDAQRQKVLGQRGNLAEARQLATDVTVLRVQIAETQQKLAKAEQEAQSVDSGVTLLGTATPPDSPSFPKTFPVMIGAIGIGGALGLLLGLLVELLNRRVRAADDLIFPDVPMIGTIRGSSEGASPRAISRILRLVAPGRSATGGIT